MRHLLLPLLASLIFACSGGSHSSTPSPAPAPAPSAPVAVPRGTYLATAHPTTSLAPSVAAVTLAPIGSLPQTMIVMNSGETFMELDGWVQLHSVIQADATGALQISPNATLSQTDGTVVPLTLTGTLVGNRMTGTTNGGAFDVTLSGIQDVPVDLTTKVGTWISTASANGQVLRLTITLHPNGDGNCNMHIDAYATTADAAAQVNSLGYYEGTLGYSDGDTAHLRNCFNAGFQFMPAGASTPLTGGTWGLAYFNETGNLVILTMAPDYSHTQNPVLYISGQVSAVFVKQ